MIIMPDPPMADAETPRAAHSSIPAPDRSLSDRYRPLGG